EDGGFYTHKGFDVEELKNSFMKNIKKMSFARGGSTITQQLAKNLYLTPEKTLTRKLKELILTKRIEERYSKDVILEKYLNVVEFGKGIYGIKAATEYYFQKPPSMVTPLEAAFIAFLLPNPDKYAVSFKKKELTPFARSRIKDILFKMQHYKKIHPAEHSTAKAQLQTMFKLAPEMEGESEDAEYYSDSDGATYDMTEIRKQQDESINKLESLPDNPPDSLETVYPDEIPASETYEVN
ncbi:MAG: biosynthetic peptidoglycan transglycosylase, partial [Bdellovibrionota bacterium]